MDVLQYTLYGAIKNHEQSWDHLISGAVQYAIFDLGDSFYSLEWAGHSWPVNCNTETAA
jgi:hypothetical protein